MVDRAIGYTRQYDSARVCMYNEGWNFMWLQLFLLRIGLRSRNKRIHPFTKLLSSSRPFSAQACTFLFSKTGSTYLNPALACMAWKHHQFILANNYSSQTLAKMPEDAEQTWLQNSSQVDVRLNISFKHSLMLESITRIYPL